MAEMIHHRARADSMRRLQRPCGDLQDLAEGTDGVSSHLGGCVRAGIGNDDDPQRVAPAGVAVSGKYVLDTLGDGVGLVPRRYDDSDGLDSGRCAALRARAKGGGRSDVLQHDVKNRNSRIKMLQTFSPSGARSACDAGHSMADGFAIFFFRGNPRLCKIHCGNRGQES